MIAITERNAECQLLYDTESQRMPPIDTFGGRVMLTRRDRDMTQEDLIKELERRGVHTAQSQLSRIENGSRAPSVELAIGIADALEVPLDYLFGRGQYSDDDFPFISAEWLEAFRRVEEFGDYKVKFVQDVIALVGEASATEMEACVSLLRLDEDTAWLSAQIIDSVSRWDRDRREFENEIYAAIIGDVATSQPSPLLSSIIGRLKKRRGIKP